MTPIETMSTVEIIDHLRTRLGCFVFLGVTGQDNETMLKGQIKLIRATHGPTPDIVVLADRLKDLIIHSACKASEVKLSSPRALTEELSRALVLQHLLKNTSAYKALLPLEGYDADLPPAP